MPHVITDRGYRLFFYSNEGDPREPIHVHVESANGVAKVWVNPESIAESHGYSGKEQRDIVKLVAHHRNLIVRKWHEHFG